MVEHEVKFLDIDPEEIEQKLKDLGADFVAEFNYRQRVYDYPDLRLAKEKIAWLRLRTDGTETTLSYKQRLGVKDDGKIGTDDGMEEIEVVVSDFAETCNILESIGLVAKFYQEKRRRRYTKDGIEFDIDFWPLIPPYIEIEAESWEEVAKGVNMLGLDENDQQKCSAGQVYEHYGYDDHDFAYLAFDRQEKK